MTRIRSNIFLNLYCYDKNEYARRLSTGESGVARYPVFAWQLRTDTVLATRFNFALGCNFLHLLRVWLPT
jgi:hypothetical protein